MPKGGMLFVCAACGRPRVPIAQPGVALSGAEQGPLALAARAQRDRLVGQGAAIVAGVFAGAALALALLVAVLGAMKIAVVASVLFVLFAIVSGFNGLRSSRAKLRIDEAMLRALEAGALDVMRVRGMVTTRMLAEQMGVSEGVADTILARLPTREDVRVDTVLDESVSDGLVRYRIAADAVPKTEPGLEPAIDPLEADFDARLQASIRSRERP